jgi:hypothetical protein
MHLQLDLLALSSILPGQDLCFTLPYEPLEERLQKLQDHAEKVEKPQALVHL